MRTILTSTVTATGIAAALLAAVPCDAAAQYRPAPQYHPAPHP